MISFFFSSAKNQGNSHSKQTKQSHNTAPAVEANAFKNATLTDEFMKWCQEQLKDLAYADCKLKDKTCLIFYLTKLVYL